MESRVEKALRESVKVMAEDKKLVMALLNEGIKKNPTSFPETQFPYEPHYECRVCSAAFKMTLAFHHRYGCDHAFEKPTDADDTGRWVAIDFDKNPANSPRQEARNDKSHE